MPVQSYVEVRDRFRKQIETNQEHCRALEQAAKNAGPAENYTPDKGQWDGNLFDRAGIIKAFDRQENTRDVQMAVRSSESSGTIGDIIASVMQGEQLACLQRAFLLLHCGRVRATMHAASRHRGHGHAAGLFRKGILAEVEDTVRRAKDIVNDDAA